MPLQGVPMLTPTSTRGAILACWWRGHCLRDPYGADDRFRTDASACQRRPVDANGSQGHVLLEVQGYLREFGIDYAIDPRLVRGFDYYTKTAFEFVSGELGAQNAIGGGGRYDNLVEEIGGSATPGIGFGLGLDRLVLTLDALGVDLPVENGIAAFVAGLGDAGHDVAVKLVSDLRIAGVSSDMDYTGKSLKSQMKLADKLGARFVIIIGEDEVAQGVVTVRDMNTKEQSQSPMGSVAETVKSFL
jgi:histidyl-tRNA synthetase